MFVLRAAAAFFPMRLNKSGTQGLSTGVTKVTAWTEDGSYPGTIDAANSRLIPPAGSDKNLTVSVTCTQAWSFYGGNIYLYKNGSSIQTIAISSSVLTALFNLTNQTFSGSDYFEVFGQSANVTYPITVQASSYMQATE